MARHQQQAQAGEVQLLLAGRSGGGFQGQLHVEGAAVIGLALHSHRAAHALHQLVDDGEAEAGAAEQPGGGTVGLSEGVEDVAVLLLGDADAGVAHLDAHTVAVMGTDGAHQHLAPFGELDRVADQVDQDLAQSGGVAGDEVGQPGVDQAGQLHPLVAGLFAEQLGDVLQHLVQVEVDTLQGELALLHFGEVEDVVDQVQQVVARPLRDLQIVLLVGAQLGVAE